MAAKAFQPILREKPAPRSKMATVRLTEDDLSFLMRGAEQLQMSLADLMRKAVDFWIVNAPEASPLRKLRG